MTTTNSTTLKSDEIELVELRTIVTTTVSKRNEKGKWVKEHKEVKETYEQIIAPEPRAPLFPTTPGLPYRATWNDPQIPGWNPLGGPPYSPGLPGLGTTWAVSTPLDD